MHEPSPHRPHSRCCQKKPGRYSREVTIQARTAEASRRETWMFSSPDQPLALHHRLISSPSFKSLEKLGLFSSWRIDRRSAYGRTLKHPCGKQVAQDSGMYTSSNYIYHHMNYIRKVTPIGVCHHSPTLSRVLSCLKSEVRRSRLHTETLLFRMSAMLRGDTHMVFRTEDWEFPPRVPLLRGSSARNLSGVTGYGVFLVNTEEGISSQNPSIAGLRPLV